MCSTRASCTSAQLNGSMQKLQPRSVQDQVQEVALFCWFVHVVLMGRKMLWLRLMPASSTVAPGICRVGNMVNG